MATESRDGERFSTVVVKKRSVGGGVEGVGIGVEDVGVGVGDGNIEGRNTGGVGGNGGTDVTPVVIDW